MSLIIEDAMDQIGDQIDTIPKLNVLPYEADAINPPCALVSLPSEINYRNTYQNGMHTAIIIVTVFVSIVNDLVRRHDIAPYADSKGARSIRQILENGSYSAFDILSVEKAMFDVRRIEDIDYLCVVFTIKIVSSRD